MRRILQGVFLLLVPYLAAVSASAEVGLSAADQAAAFKAAGFSARGDEYVRCDDTVTASRQAGTLEVADLNHDGFPEAFVRESSVYCYGNTAEAFVLVSKQTNGAWKILLDEVGIPVMHESQNMGWPDIEVGGPGPGPFPRFSFDGTAYAESR